MINSERLLVALIINRLPCLSATERKRLFDFGLTLSQYQSITIECIAEIVGRPLRPHTFNLSTILLFAERDYSYLQMRNIEVLLIEDMPILLQQITDPPFLLFVRGTPLPVMEIGLAVVGTRCPSDAAIQASISIGRETAKEGLTLVSGLAYGVDVAVMESALRNNGRVIAVLGNGIDYVYPGQHQKIARRIVEQGGTIVSEYAPSIAPLRYHFPARNRIISGLSRAVLLMEASQRSGALITAKHALVQGRDLFVHTVSVSQGAVANVAGGNALVPHFAKELSSVRQLRSIWGYIGVDEHISHQNPPRYFTRAVKYHADFFCQKSNEAVLIG